MHAPVVDLSNEGKRSTNPPAMLRDAPVKTTSTSNVYIGNIIDKWFETLGDIALRLGREWWVCVVVWVDANITTFSASDRNARHHQRAHSFRLFDANYKTDYKNNGLWRVDQEKKTFRAEQTGYTHACFFRSLLKSHYSATSSTRLTSLT
jgi:hypothetical protein